MPIPSERCGKQDKCEKYQEWRERFLAKDALGNKIAFLRKLIEKKCREVAGAQQMKRQFNFSLVGISQITMDVREKTIIKEGIIRKINLTYLKEKPIRKSTININVEN